MTVEGRLVEGILTGRQAHDVTAAAELSGDLVGRVMIGTGDMTATSFDWH
jgi:hypothetical protein